MRLLVVGSILLLFFLLIVFAASQFLASTIGPRRSINQPDTSAAYEEGQPPFSSPSLAPAPSSSVAPQPIPQAQLPAPKKFRGPTGQPFIIGPKEPPPSY